MGRNDVGDVASTVERVGGRKAVCAMLGVNPATLSRWITANRIRDGYVALALADEVGGSPARRWALACRLTGYRA